MCVDEYLFGPARCGGVLVVVKVEGEAVGTREEEESVEVEL